MLTNGLILGGFAIWRILSRYTVSIDASGVAATTLFRKLRKLPPVHLNWSDGIAAEACGTFWHRSVTINGLHLETPDVWSLNQLRNALRAAQIPVRETAGTATQFAAGALYFGLIFAGCLLIVSVRNAGFGIYNVCFGAALVITLLHQYRVDQAWRRIA